MGWRPPDSCHHHHTWLPGLLRLVHGNLCEYIQARLGSLSPLLEPSRHLFSFHFILFLACRSLHPRYLCPAYCSRPVVRHGSDFSRSGSARLLHSTVAVSLVKEAENQSNETPYCLPDCLPVFCAFIHPPPSFAPLPLAGGTYVISLPTATNKPHTQHVSC